MFTINFEPREYQKNISKTCLKDNCLVVLPTGLGKTKTAILALVERLNLHPNSKVLFLTVTKPLAAQIRDEIVESTNIPENQVVLFTGKVKPEKRKEMWQDSIVIISTPQCIENDVMNKSMDISDVSLLVIDEAHHTTKKYSYNWIAKYYGENAQYPRIIGLTASPGSDAQTIREICRNLQAVEIEIRSHDDVDVKPYVHKTDIEWLMVDLPESFIEIRNHLEHALKKRFSELKSWGLVGPNQDMIGKKQLISLQVSIQHKLGAGEKNIRLWQGISKTAESLKIHHAVELLETQGISQLVKYLKAIYDSASKTKVKAVKNIVNDSDIKIAFEKAKRLQEKPDLKEPKLIALKDILEKRFDRSGKAIIFTQYRDSGSKIEALLKQIEGIKPKLFTGQAKKDGMGLSQKQQAEIINDFEKGDYNILIATQVAEQGLDIPEVNLIIFHEPIPSAIRTIQRKGRTGRHSSGKIIILITKGTRDEAYHWAAFNKEKRMYRELKTMKNSLKLDSQPMLDVFKIEEKHISPDLGYSSPASYETSLGNEKETQPKLWAIVDQRERSSKITKHLIELGIEIKTEQLEVADYILSDNVAVELKTKSDFVNSIIDGRMLSQLRNMRSSFNIPLLVLEGSEDIYSLRNIHPNAIRGMLSTIAIDYNIPIIQTKNNKDTAELFKVIIDREQNRQFKDFPLRPEKKPFTLREQQQFIIESLPGIGPTLAKSLLREFKSVKNIINADEQQLQNTPLVGPKKASDIQKVTKGEYKEKNKEKN